MRLYCHNEKLPISGTRLTIFVKIPKDRHNTSYLYKVGQPTYFIFKLIHMEEMVRRLFYALNARVLSSNYCW